MLLDMFCASADKGDWFGKRMQPLVQKIAAKFWSGYWSDISQPKGGLKLDHSLKYLIPNKPL